MATAERGGAQIYYQLRGQGPHHHLLEGLAYGNWMWRGQSPALESKFRLILLDNRGVGKSSLLPGPYSAPEFARDALAVLDAEGIERATVLGASMGGAIAQSLAALAPQRVASLVLACTLPGGPDSKPMPGDTWTENTRKVPGESEPNRLRRTRAVAMTPRFPVEHADLVVAIAADRLASPTEGAQWMYQAMSLRDFDAVSSDARLTCPVLLTTGTEDRVVPWVNSLLLYKLIPRASLDVFRGQNHLHLIERPAEFNEAVIRFLTGAPSALPAGRVEEVR